MSMKKQTDEKKKKKLTKKLKKIRGVVMMMMVCVLLLSAATYAWFSLSNLARVSNLTLAVSEADGLQVAINEATDDGAGKTPDEDDWKGFIDLSESAVIKGVLKPATTTNGVQFKVPDYNDSGVVTGIKTEGADATAKELNKNQTENTAATEGHFYRYSFWMRSLKDDATIRLVHGDSTAKTGTYVTQIRYTDTDTKIRKLLTDRGRENVNHDDKKSNIPASAAMRVSIIPGADYTDASTRTPANYMIFEPWCDYTLDNNTASTRVKAEVDTNYVSQSKDYASKLLQQKRNGEFIGGTGTDSATAFTLVKDTPTLITLLIWIEGEDVECYNQIQMDDLMMQLQFEKVKTN